MRQSLYNTVTGKSNLLQKTLSSTAEFLISNHEAIAIDPQIQEKLIMQEEKIIDTAISKLYKGLMRTEALSKITLVDLTKTSSVPPILTSSWISLDVQALCQAGDPSCRALSAMSSYRNQIIFDFSKYFSKVNNKINDSTNFQGRILRSLMNRSYDNFHGGSWLSPMVVYYLAKIYSKMVANGIARYYNLDIYELSKVEAIAAIYFASRCSDTSKGDKNVAPIVGKLDFIKKVDIQDICAHINSEYEEFGLAEMLSTIIKFCPDRLKMLSRATFFSMNINIASSQLESLIAIEHPPYFAYTVIEAMSGSKTSMFRALKTFNLQKDAKDLVLALVAGDLVAKDI